MIGVLVDVLLFEVLQMGVGVFKGVGLLRYFFFFFSSSFCMCVCSDKWLLFYQFRFLVFKIGFFPLIYWCIRLAVVTSKHFVID